MSNRVVAHQRLLSRRGTVVLRTVLREALSASEDRVDRVGFAQMSEGDGALHEYGHEELVLLRGLLDDLDRFAVVEWVVPGLGVEFGRAAR